MKFYLIFNPVWTTVRVTSNSFAEESFFRFCKSSFASSDSISGSKREKSLLHMSPEVTLHPNTGTSNYIKPGKILG